MKNKIEKDRYESLFDASNVLISCDDFSYHLHEERYSCVYANKVFLISI